MKTNVLDLSSYQIKDLYSKLVPGLMGVGREERRACPIHDGDNETSLSVNHEKHVWYCHTRCDRGGDIYDLISAMYKCSREQAYRIAEELLGMVKVEAPLKTNPAILVQDQPTQGALSKVEIKPKIVKTYDYFDLAGTLRFQAVRYEPKGFKQRRPDGSGGWLYNLKGIDPMPYRLPELQGADHELPVFIVEGEKDVDALTSMGLVATCNPMGAGKWRDSFGGYLKGRHIVILPDNDDPGLNHAEDVYNKLEDLAASIKILVLPNLPAKGDVSDWLASGGSKGELLKMVEEQPTVARAEPHPIEGQHKGRLPAISAKALQTMEFPELRWAATGLLPQGLIVLAGKPKLGKSWLALGLSISVARGGNALGSPEYPCTQGEALYVGLEDTPQRFKNRLGIILQGQFWPDGLYVLDQIRRMDQGGFEELEEWLDQHPNCRLVVIDTLARFRRPARPGQNVYDADYAVMSEIQAFAAKRNITMILVTHVRKDEAGDVFDSVTGSTGITGAADASLVLKRYRGENEATLHITGRDIEETSLALAFAEGVWTLLGDALTHSLSKARQEIIDELLNSDEAMTPTDLAKALGKNSNAIKKLLCSMFKDGQVTRESGCYRSSSPGNPGNPTNSMAPKPFEWKPFKDDEEGYRQVTELPVTSTCSNPLEPCDDEPGGPWVTGVTGEESLLEGQV